MGSSELNNSSEQNVSILNDDYLDMVSRLNDDYLDMSSPCYSCHSYSHSPFYSCHSPLSDSPHSHSPHSHSPHSHSPHSHSPHSHSPHSHSPSPIVGENQVEQDENPDTLKSRCNSGSSECSSSASSNGSIENHESYARLYVNDNPTDSSTTILVDRSRLEFLEFLNENLASIIEQALKDGVTVSSHH